MDLMRIGAEILWKGLFVTTSLFEANRMRVRWHGKSIPQAIELFCLMYASAEEARKCMQRLEL